MVFAVLFLVLIFGLLLLFSELHFLICRRLQLLLHILFLHEEKPF